MKDEMKTKKQLVEELITIRKRVEEGEASKLRYQTIFETTGTTMLIVEEDMTISLANHGFESLTGYKREEIEGKKKWTEFIEKGDLEKMVAQHQLRRADSSLAKKTYEFRLVHRDGHLKNIFLTVDVIPGTKKSIASLMDITARKQAEQALWESEKKYRQLFMNAPAAIYEVDYRNRCFTSINDMIPGLTGYSREELMEMDPWKMFTEASRKTYLKRMRLMKQGGDVSASQEYELRKKDGGVLWVNMNIDYAIEDGMPVRARIVAHDITDRKRAEVALQESEERYRTLVENANDILFRTDSTGHFTFINPVALRLSGFTPEELIGKHYLATIRPDMRDAAANFFGRQFVKKLENTYFEYPIIIKSGEERWIGQNTQLMLEDGKLVGFQAVARDVTERKQFEAALSESEELYKTLAESSLAGVFIAQDGKFRFINNSAIAYAGYSAEELVGRSADIIVHPDDKESVKSKSREMLSGRSNQAFEFRMVTKQNDVRWLSQTVTPINYRGRRAILGNAMDITDRKRMEEKLRENERKYRYLYQQFRAILNAIPSAVLLSPDLKVVWANEGAATSMNISEADFIGQYCYQVRHARSEPCEMCPVLECFTSGRPTSGESVTPDDRIWELHAMPIFGDQGEVKSVIEAHRDISARKQAEEARYHHEKIKGVLEMAGAICHEMNQPMQIISGYSEMLLMNISEDDPIYTKLDRINKQVHRMATITRKLMKIKDYETQDYAGLSRIIDINKSSDKDTE